MMARVARENGQRRVSSLGGAVSLVLCLATLQVLGACALPNALRLPSTKRLASRAEHLEAELRRAEWDLDAAEEHLRGYPTRAAAVSSLVEARIQVEDVAQAAPWLKKKISEAERLLRDADRQMRNGRFGAAMFFGDRARRIAEKVHGAAKQAALQEQTGGSRGVR